MDTTISIHPTFEIVATSGKIYISPLSFLGVAIADSSALLDIAPSDTIEEQGFFDQKSFDTDTGARKIVIMQTTPRCYVSMYWDNISDDDLNTISDIYLSVAKGRGRERSFRWKHPLTKEIYVARFTDKFTSEIRSGVVGRQSTKKLTLEILGKSAV